MRFLIGFFRKLWHGLDVFRRVLHLILLVLIFAIVVGAFRESLPSLPERGALVVWPAGDIVEQLSGDCATVTTIRIPPSPISLRPISRDLLVSGRLGVGI